MRRRPAWLAPLAQASVAALLMGMAATATGRIDRDWRWWMLAHLAVGSVMGAWNAGRAWICWLPLGTGMALVHLAEVSFRGPFDYPSRALARADLVMLAPAAAGLAFGSLVRVGLSLGGWFREPDGEPARILPRSTAAWMATVLGAAVAFPILRWAVVDSGTIYAPGFDEARFRSIRLDTSAEEVMRLLGPPLEVVPPSRHRGELWLYADSCHQGRRHWARRVLFLDAEGWTTIRGGYDDSW